jgi:hypothetical protein
MEMINNNSLDGLVVLNLIKRVLIHCCYISLVLFARRNSLVIMFATPILNYVTNLMKFRLLCCMSFINFLSWFQYEIPRKPHSLLTQMSNNAK